MIKPSFFTILPNLFKTPDTGQSSWAAAGLIHSCSVPATRHGVSSYDYRLLCCIQVLLFIDSYQTAAGCTSLVLPTLTLCLTNVLLFSDGYQTNVWLFSDGYQATMSYRLFSNGYKTNVLMLNDGYQTILSYCLVMANVRLFCSVLATTRLISYC